MKKEQKVKRVAFAIMNNRISPRFCFSENIKIIEMDINNVILKDTLVKINFQDSSSIVNYIIENNIDVIICGGINHYYQDLLKEEGIEVIWGLIGNYKKVIQLYKQGKLYENRNYCYRRRCRKRQGTPFFTNKQKGENI